MNLDGVARGAVIQYSRGAAGDIARVAAVTEDQQLWNSS
jgi:hypothetical protein